MSCYVVACIIITCVLTDLGLTAHARSAGSRTGGWCQPGSRGRGQRGEHLVRDTVQGGQCHMMLPGWGESRPSPSWWGVPDWRSVRPRHLV